MERDKSAADMIREMADDIIEMLKKEENCNSCVIAIKIADMNCDGCGKEKSPIVVRLSSGEVKPFHSPEHAISCMVSDIMDQSDKCRKLAEHVN